MSDVMTSIETNGQEMKQATMIVYWRMTGIWNGFANSTFASLSNECMQTESGSLLDWLKQFKHALCGQTRRLELSIMDKGNR